ncbi:hypothetical protein [Rhodanobacter sp. FW106-PBR-LB-2-11]|uniref:hypothetical protein n=1 Tax=Rhodanobacter sp. FW106-PBR-LB-2-11 TaxID=1524463 RepID=UPI003F745CC1
MSGGACRRWRGARSRRSPLASSWLPGTQAVLAQPGWLLADSRAGAAIACPRWYWPPEARTRRCCFPLDPARRDRRRRCAGAGQAGWPLRVKRRALVAGSGPLLLAAAATLRAHGARLLGIHEQAPLHTAHFALRLPRWPGKALQALALRRDRLTWPTRRRRRSVAAHGDDVLREVEIDVPRGARNASPATSSRSAGLVPDRAGRAAGLPP